MLRGDYSWGMVKAVARAEQGSPGQRKAVIQVRDDDGLRNSCGDGSEVVGYQIYVEGRAERIC